MTMPTLDALYPEGTFIAPRREDDGPSWARVDLPATEFMTANLIACAGRLPMLVQKGAMSPAGLALQERCGVAIGSAIEVYATPGDYDAAVARRLRNGETAAFVHPVVATGERAARALVHHDQLRFLNDKRNIPRLAGAGNVPARRSVDLSSAAERAGLTTPVVLKIATGEPSAGGMDVAVCRGGRQLRRALSRFAGAGEAIAESFVEASGNWCLQFAVLPDGEVREIGWSEQVCLRNGVHAGNLLTADRCPPARAASLGRAIATEGSRLGFRGVCGFDILVDRQDKPFAIDLNFRPVSSTAFVHEIVRRRTREGTGRLARLAFLSADATLPKTIERCAEGFREGWLVPLATFDPEHGGLAPGPARLRVAILADDRRTLHRREASLAARGIDFHRTPTRWSEFLAAARALV